MASLFFHALTPLPRRRKKKAYPLDTGEPSLRSFSSTSEDLYLGPPPSSPPPSPSLAPPRTRSIGVQTPTLPRRGVPMMPGDATPTTPRRRREHPLPPTDPSSTSALRGLLLSLTPMLGRKRAVGGRSSSPSSPALTPASSSFTIRAESSSFQMDSRPSTPSEGDPEEDVGVLVVEVGAAGLQFGAREYAHQDFIDDVIAKRKARGRPTNRGDSRTALRSKRVSFIPDDVRGVTKVILKKEPHTTLGLIVAGGIDKGHRPRVSNLRAHSPASESDALTVGDYILSVNGTPTAGLTHDAVVGLLRGAGDSVELELEYEMPKMPASFNGSVAERTVSIILQKENGTFGFTVRGGMSPDGVQRPLLVTHVRPGGPADREGSLKAGDRLVALDGKDLTRCSLPQAQIELQEVENSATLAIRFDISVMDTVRCGGSPLLVEIERCPGAPLGITLNSSRSTFNIYNNNFTNSSSNSIVIDSIRTASIAERCGALAVGDAVCAVDGIRIDQNTLKEVNQILSGGQGHKVTLEVIPSRTNGRGRDESPVLTSPSCARRFSLYNTLNPTRTLGANNSRRQRRLREDSSLSPGVANTMKSTRDEPGGVSHTEVVRVTLLSDGRNVGVALRPAPDDTFPMVAAIDPGGAVDKSGVIMVGDRLLGVNGRSVSGVGVSEVTQMMANTRPTVILDVEVEVADAVVPSSGTFSIKLSKRNCSLGIGVARERPPGPQQPAPVLISAVSRGSAAHRSGTLQVGDRILAVDNTRLESLPLSQVQALLASPSDVIALKVQKDDLCSDESSIITYTVQLHRDKGALGISATGSEEPFDPIIVGGIVPGSVASQTGAIHVGDRLLCINGFSLRGKPLSEAVRLLQGNEDSVTLKISRPKLAVGMTGNGVTQDWIGFHGHPALSVDSAVESWGSGGIDPHQNIPTPLNTKTDSTPELFRSNCGSTVRRKLTTKTSSSDHGSAGNEKRKSWDCSSPSSDSGQSEDGTDWDKMIADLNQISATCGLREKSVLHDANGNVMSSANSSGDLDSSNSASNSCPKDKGPSCDASNSSFKAGRRTASPEVPDEGTYSVTYATALHRASSPSSPEDGSSPPAHVFTLSLAKDPFYEDFGFSVSDGLYEKGVYVNRIRKGGPAHRSGLLRPYDRILQVNDTLTEDFDCCLTVPLIASAEDSLFLKVSRPTGAPPSFRLISDLRMNAWLEAEDEDSLNGTSSSFLNKGT